LFSLEKDGTVVKRRKEPILGSASSQQTGRGEKSGRVGGGMRERRKRRAGKNRKKRHI